MSTARSREGAGGTSDGMPTTRSSAAPTTEPRSSAPLATGRGASPTAGWVLTLAAVGAALALVIAVVVGT
jgi:hypothetical protein